MNKKRIFAIVVFIILGLFMYTFANPLNNDKDDNANQNNAGENANSNSPLANNDDNTNNATRDTRRANNATPVVQVANQTQDAVVVNPTPAQDEDNRPSIEPVVVDLTLDKVNAVNELVNYKSGYEFEDDTDYKETIKEFTDKINESESVTDIKKNLEDGKDAIDKLIEDDLSAYKEAAKTEISLYAAQLNLTTDVTNLLKDFYDDIDEATTKSAIDKIVEDAKAKLDEIKAAEILAAYKEAAKEEIADYAEELELTTDVSELLVDFNGDIDEAEDKDSVDKVVEAAKKKLDGVKDAEIAKAKLDAKDEIDKQNKEDETNLSELVNIKEEGKGNVDKAETIGDIDEAKEAALEAIKDYIDNQKYTVVFYGLMNKKLSTQTVGYKKAATIPTMKAKQKGWNNSIEVEFLGWDTEADTLNAVTSNLEVHAQFKVLKATTKISILKEGLKNKDGSEKTISTDVKDFNHPFNKPEAEKDTYLDLTINDAITAAVNNYRGSHVFVYEEDNDTIRSVVNGEPDVYDNNKYKELQYYVLKLQGDRFHCDARVIYNHAAELADAIEDAKKAINDYKPVETEDIDEIKTTKSEAITAIGNMASVDDVKNKVQSTKAAIDEIINNKTYDVTFVGKTSSKTVKVGYNKDAVAPTEKDYTNPVYRNVTYKLTGWDKSLKNIKTNTTITASYDIEKVVASVFLLTNKANVPADRTTRNAGKYEFVKYVELKVTDTIKTAIKNNEYAVIYIDEKDIVNVLKDKKSLPENEGKYKEYEYYVMKFLADGNSYDGFHIDGILLYDELAEKTDELKGLIKDAKAVDKTGKTSKSIGDLDTAISNAETAIDKKDLDAIKASITALTNPTGYLVDIEVTEVKVVDKKEKHTYIEGQPFVLEVKYSDNNGTKDKVITQGYTINGDTKTVGKDQKATVTYGEKKSNEFTYTVIKKVATSLTVVNNQYEYFINENENITVTATYNDGSSRKLDSKEYTSTFYSNKTTYTGLFGKNEPRKATVTVDGVSKKYEYSVSTFTKDEYNRKLINDIYITLPVTVHLFDSNEYFVHFNKMSDKVKLISISQNGTKSINLKSTSTKNKYSLKYNDYETLIDNNTFFAGNHIDVIYEVHGMKYRARYTEGFGLAFLPEITRI